MKITLSDCETFLTLDDMKFMTIQDPDCTCEGCYFDDKGGCYFDDKSHGAYPGNIPLCMPNNRSNNIAIIWLRME